MCSLACLFVALCRAYSLVSLPLRFLCLLGSLLVSLLGCPYANAVVSKPARTWKGEGWFVEVKVCQVQFVSVAVCLFVWLVGCIGNAVTLPLSQLC